MTEPMNIEERLEVMAGRLERVERVNRLMKVWGTIAIAGLIAAGPFSTKVMAKKPPKPQAMVVATQEFDLQSGGKTVASLKLDAGGKPNLVFFDSAGKTVVDVGIVGTLALPAGHAAGVAVFDGNEDIPGTGKVRASLGVTPSGPTSGAGTSSYDGNGVIRTALGSPIDGSTSYAALFDATGTARTGLNFDPAGNFSGTYSNDASGNNRVAVGSGVDGSYSGAFMKDTGGTLRDQIIYVPSANFNGFQSWDGAGHELSTMGNFLVDDAPHFIEANQSFLSLNDTAGTLRLLEFQNNTNEGGIDFNAGSTTVQGSWGNP